MTVTAADFLLAWGMGKNFDVRLQVGRLALWKFQSFQLRTRLVSAPGSWTNRGAKTNFSPSFLWWSLSGLTEGEDYVFELTVTELAGVVTVTEVAANVGFV